MSHYSIDPFNGESIELTFRCPKCNTEITTDELQYPSADYSADTIHDSVSSEEYDETCPNCGEVYSFGIYVSMADGYIDLPFDEKFIVSAEEKSSPAFDEYVDNQVDIALADGLQFENFEIAIQNCDAMFGLAEQEQHLATVLRMQAYAGLVTALESYLSNMFINRILLDDGHFKRFVETFEKFTKEQLKVSEYYNFGEKLRNKVKYELTEIVYHNLFKVKKIFEGVFSKPFPEAEELEPIIKNRHHIVHRNGRDKDDNEIVIDQAAYDQAKNIVVGFIDKIHKLIV